MMATYEYMKQRLERMKAERPDDYEREKKRDSEWRKEKYRSDPEARAKRQAYGREYYYRVTKPQKESKAMTISEAAEAYFNNNWVSRCSEPLSIVVALSFRAGAMFERRKHNKQ